MTFWLVCIVMTLGVAAIVIAPLRRQTDAPAENPDVVVYRAQLDEI